MFLDNAGRFIVSNRFSKASALDERGVALVEENGRLGRFDSTNLTVTPFRPDSDVRRLGETWPVQLDWDGFHNGLVSGRFRESRSGGNWRSGYFDEEGHLSFSGDWEEARPFRNGLAAVRQSGKWGFVDRDGRLCIPFRFKAVCDFSENGFAIAQEEGGLHGIIDRHGDWAVEPRYLFFSPSGISHNSVGAVNPKTKRFRIIDCSGRPLFLREFDSADSFSEGLACVSENGKYGFIDRNGSFVIFPQFDDALPFSEGLAAVKSGDRWGYVNADGMLAIGFWFVTAGNFEHGVARANLKTSNGTALVLVDSSGHFLFSTAANGQIH